MGQLRGSSPLFQVGSPALPGEADREIVDFLSARVSGEILDMGGGKGAYAHALAQRGHSVTLAEMDRSSLEVARSIGLPVVDMNTTPWEELENRFGTVLLVEVLEHVEDPLDFLRRVSRCAPKILLTVPCNDDFSRLFRWHLTYNHVAVTDHLHQFTSADVTSLFAMAGCRSSLHTGAPLFPNTILPLLREGLKGRFWGWLALLPARVLNKAGLLPKLFPTRIFVEASVGRSEA